jgi:hypothetical protein
VILKDFKGELVRKELFHVGERKRNREISVDENTEDGGQEGGKAKCDSGN